MKYSEFIREIKELGYQVDSHPEYQNIYVENKDEEIIIDISEVYTYVFNVNYHGFRSLHSHERDKLIHLAYRLAETPLDEREDEKRYRLRIPFMNDEGYLNMGKENGSYYLSNKAETSVFRTIFTESEAEELKQNYNLDSFVLEEVKEDE